MDASQLYANADVPQTILFLTIRSSRRYALS